jgi:hypothetical protein
VAKPNLKGPSAQSGAEVLKALFDYEKSIVAQQNIKCIFWPGAFVECRVLLAWVGERNRLVQQLN